MEIGKLNQRITILENHTKTDSIGNHLNIWEEIASCWAEVKVRTSQNAEKISAGVTKEIRTLLFTIRQCPSVAYINSTTHKILFRNKIYNILSVQLDYSHGELMTITCEIHEAGENDDFY